MRTAPISSADGESMSMAQMSSSKPAPPSSPSPGSGELLEVSIGMSGAKLTDVPSGRAAEGGLSPPQGKAELPVRPHAANNGSCMLPSVLTVPTRPFGAHAGVMRVSRAQPSVPCGATDPFAVERLEDVVLWCCWALWTSSRTTKSTSLALKSVPVKRQQAGGMSGCLLTGLRSCAHKACRWDMSAHLWLPPGPRARGPWPAGWRAPPGGGPGASRAAPRGSRGRRRARPGDAERRLHPHPRHLFGVAAGQDPRATGRRRRSREMTAWDDEDGSDSPRVRHGLLGS